MQCWLPRAVGSLPHAHPVIADTGLSLVLPQAVARETLEVWCPVAERLGIFSLKAELEDLCFAVLHPQEYQSIR